MAGAAWCNASSCHTQPALRLIVARELGVLLGQGAILAFDDAKDAPGKRLQRARA
jgi:hypothetical protein